MWKKRINRLAAVTPTIEKSYFCCFFLLLLPYTFNTCSNDSLKNLFFYLHEITGFATSLIRTFCMTSTSIQFSFKTANWFILLAVFFTIMITITNHNTAPCETKIHEAKLQIVKLKLVIRRLHLRISMIFQSVLNFTSTAQVYFNKFSAAESDFFLEQANQKFHAYFGLVNSKIMCWFQCGQLCEICQCSADKA